MGDGTAIAWTQATWSPTTGCTHVSAGCDHCYAERMAHRLRGRAGYPLEEPFRLTLHPDRLQIPCAWRKPRLIFVDSMSDLFHPEVPFEFIAQVWSVMERCPRHTFQVLTKRPERMAEWLSRKFWLRLGPVLPNVWLGTSTESQQTARLRIPYLLQCPAAVRFLSCEPLLGPLCLSNWLQICPMCMAGNREPPIRDCYGECDNCHGRCGPEGSGLGWVIAGGESGPGARRCDPDWLRVIRDECVAAGVPFFLKQLGGHPDSRSHERAVLDGQTWTQMPGTTREAAE